jgi:glucose uptake protein GlcU
VNKSIRNLALVATLLFSAAPMFANRMGTNPHPQAIGVSLGDYVSIILTVAGL